MLIRYTYFYDRGTDSQDCYMWNESHSLKSFGNLAVDINNFWGPNLVISNEVRVFVEVTKKNYLYLLTSGHPGLEQIAARWGQ